jgi:hypothetical protein
MSDSSEKISSQRRPSLTRYVRWAAKRRARMIEDLVNLRDDAVEWFWRKWRADYINTKWNRPLPEYREELQAIWSIPLSQSRESTTLTDVRLQAWLNEAHKPRRLTWMLWSGCVLPDFRNFPLSIALAVSEQANRMAICPNPECPQKYFLRNRKTRRYCDRPACIEYGQREFKREWWKRVGAKRRVERSGTAKSQNRKGRKRR